MNLEYINTGKSLLINDIKSDRIYIYKIYEDDIDIIFIEIDNLLKKHNHTKIFAKVPSKFQEIFLKHGFFNEAQIDNFFDNSQSLTFMSKFLNEERQILSTDDKTNIEYNLNIAFKRSNQSFKTPILNSQFEYKPLVKSNSKDLAKLYKIVFESYPFPIDDPQYIESIMDNGVYFFGVFYQDNLIAASSAETDSISKSAEMTDFATLSEFNGNGISNYLLNKMEEFLKSMNYQTSFTIARALSPSMNITFSRNNYKYCGTLINNTNIFGRIESMNVWAKNIL